MMKFIYLLPIASLIILQPTIANALSPEQLQSIAKSVTLKIEASGGGTGDSGSGVIIQKQGNNYTLATNAHVVCGNSQYLSKCSKHTKYNIVTPDGKFHAATDTAVKLFPGLDLAIVQFQSDRNYPVATLGDSDKLTIDAPIYAAGFPLKKGFNFNSGSIVASVKNRLQSNDGKYSDSGGYTVIYDAATNPGMSGGGVFDRAGRVIAIHGSGDRYPTGAETSIDFDRMRADFSTSFPKLSDSLIGQKLGINRGIPINFLRQELPLSGSARTISNNKPFQPSTADDWFILAKLYKQRGDDKNYALMQQFIQHLFP
jgi:S1-C subfamily serine protease